MNGDGNHSDLSRDAEHDMTAAYRQELTADIPERGTAYDQRTSWRRMNLVLSATDQPLVTLDNICRVLTKHPDTSAGIWFDEFQQRIMTDWRTPGAGREITNADYISLTKFMQRSVGLHRCTSTTVREAVADTAMLCVLNELTEWLDSLKWDGAERLKYLMSIGFGADHNPYTEAVGRTFVHGMVARAYSPGCKVDTMPVFEGPQGAFKSTGLVALVGERWFAESGKEVTHTDFFMALQGKLLIEISELDNFNKSTVESVKRVVSCRVDRYRAPYAFKPEDHPRMSVFAGTTNRTDWNRDETGARRFYPVACGHIDIPWIRANREQLFAEACQLWRDGKPWWDVPQDEAKREQDARRSVDTWEESIERHLIGRSEVTVGELLTEAIRIPIERHDRSNQMRVASVLTLLGWSRSTKWRNKKPVKLWTAPGGKAEDSEIL